jgi:CHAT domain-containing protein
MVSFYTNLMRRNMTKGEALRKAQLEMANKGVDPYYFAAFQLFGDPGPLGK